MTTTEASDFETGSACGVSTGTGVGVLRLRRAWVCGTGNGASGSTPLYADLVIHPGGRLVIRLVFAGSFGDFERRNILFLRTP
ncbi:hypothetical protein SAMN02787142_0571 [Burkholderia sp. WP9]|nr:hypothetical protein SAMN02787142_0571 [Burkholderia sp. WP9]